MSYGNYIEADAYQDTLGMDTTSSLPAVKPGFVRDARNARVALTGGYVKRDGYTVQTSSAWGSRSITGGIEYKNTSGSLFTMVYGVDGTDGRIGSFSGGSVSDSLTGLSKTARPSLATANDLLFFYNGVDTPKVFDGSAWRQIGITAPATAPTIVLAGGGSLNTSANYLWAYTYYNSITGAESTPSALSAVTATGANTQGTLTISAGSATTADTIRVYRTVANGNQLFLDGTAAISATSYVSTVADIALTAALELDNTRITQISSTAQYPTVAANRVFLKIGNGLVGFSKIGQSGPMPESFEVKNRVRCMGKWGNSDEIVGLASIGDTPIVLKERSVGRLDAMGLPDTTLSIDNVGYTYVEASANAGALSHWAAQTVYGEVVYAGRDNIYATNGQSVRPVANSMSATIRGFGLLASQVTSMSSENNERLKEVYFNFFFSATDTVPAYVLVGNYERYPEFRWTWHTPGTNTTTHPGIRAGSFFTVTNTTDGVRDTWFGNLDSSGHLYKMNSGTSDNGNGIYFKVLDRPEAFGRPNAMKLFKGAGAVAVGNGSDYDLTVKAIYDFSSVEVSSFTQSLYASGGQWDIGLWDTAYWTDDSTFLVSYASHRKAKFQQLAFYQIEADAPVSIYGWSAKGSIFGVTAQ